MGKLSVSAGNQREKGWVVQDRDSRIQQTKKKEHHREVSEKEC